MKIYHGAELQKRAIITEWKKTFY